MAELTEEVIAAIEAKAAAARAHEERYRATADKHLSAAKWAESKGRREKFEDLAAKAYAATRRADRAADQAAELEMKAGNMRRRLGLFQQEKDRLTALSAKLVDRLARTKKAAPHPLTDRQRREEEKRARLYEQGERAKKRSLAQANVVYDNRIASGRRDYQVENLGPLKRARSHPYKKLFRNLSEATDIRVLACERYDKLWHMAHQDQMPAPRFEPLVDTSTIPDVMNGNAHACAQMDALRSSIGDEAAAMLYARVVMGFGYRAMEANGHGDERRLSIAFVNAVDSVARYFGFMPVSGLVSEMRMAMQRP